jgi:hypothetical protein
MDYDTLVTQLATITHPTNNVAAPPSFGQVTQLFGGISFMGLTVSFVFGVVGMYYLKGAKNGDGFIKGLCGLGLCIYPFFVSSTWGLLAVGLLITFLPNILRR